MRRSGRKVSWERFLESKNGIFDLQDKISSLPETVLQHMMSFLPPSDKDQVRFLSKKWRRLCAQNQTALSLTRHRLNELEFLKILNDEFHSVTSLSLTQCPGMRNLTLVNNILVTITLNYCGGLKHLYLNTPNLETLYFHGPRARPCIIEFMNCKRLRVLYLVGVAMNTMMFINCNESFPHLQRLTLAGCDMSGCISISSNSLHELSFIRFNNPVGLTIDAPNLRSFKYNGSTIAPSQNIHLPRLLLAYVELYPNMCQKRDKIWFTRLTEMLHCLKHARMLQFSTNSNKNIIIPKYLRGTLVPPLVETLQIAVRTKSRSTNIVNLADSMLWVSPRLNNLTCSSNFWMFVLLMAHDESSAETPEYSCRFCASLPSRCWRHSVIAYSLNHSISDLEMRLYLQTNLKRFGRSGIDWDNMNSLNDIM